MRSFEPIEMPATPSDAYRSRLNSTDGTSAMTQAQARSAGEAGGIDEGTACGELVPRTNGSIT